MACTSAGWSSRCSSSAWSSGTVEGRHLMKERTWMRSVFQSFWLERRSKILIYIWHHWSKNLTVNSSNLYYSSEHAGTLCVFVSVSMTTPTAWDGFIAMVTSIARTDSLSLSLSFSHTHNCNPVLWWCDTIFRTVIKILAHFDLSVLLISPT